VLRFLEGGIGGTSCLDTSGKDLGRDSWMGVVGEDCKRGEGEREKERKRKRKRDKEKRIP